MWQCYTSEKGSSYSNRYEGGKSIKLQTLDSANDIEGIGPHGHKT